jgi:hypothetical protein
VRVLARINHLATMGKLGAKTAIRRALKITKDLDEAKKRGLLAEIHAKPIGRCATRSMSQPAESVSTCKYPPWDGGSFHAGAFQLRSRY